MATPGQTHQSHGPQTPTPQNTPPVPDPTVMTTEQLDRTVDALRDYVNAQVKYIDERFRGIDEASKVLAETVSRFPTHIQQEIGHVRELMTKDEHHAKELIKAHDEHDREMALLREASSQKAIDKADSATQKAIDKTETATVAALTRLEALFSATTGPINKNLDDLKSRMDRLEAAKLGGSERVAEGRQHFSYVTGVIVFAFFVLTALGTLIALNAAQA